MHSEIIQINNLRKKFKGAVSFAVDGLSLNIHRGEIFGLLGPNGAGKTTTISMLCGLIRPGGGSVVINGFDIAANPSAVRSIIGVVPQDLALYPTLTARENLSFFGNMYGIGGHQLKNRIEYWLHAFGLDSAADRRVSVFSGGMKRRVNLIAGILHDPQILFLDEPTVGVDVQSRAVIIDHLRSLNESGMTIVYTSHHLDEAESFCHRVGIIDNGKLIAEGTPADLNAASGGGRLEDVFLELTHRALRD